jgi:hypothetical protein
MSRRFRLACRRVAVALPDSPQQAGPAARAVSRDQEA